MLVDKLTHRLADQLTDSATNSADQSVNRQSDYSIVGQPDKKQANMER
jgi:hypothetical protein